MSATLCEAQFYKVSFVFQSPEGNDRYRATDKYCGGRCIEESWVPLEGEAMVGPVGKVGGGVQDGEPGHCHSKADGKMDRRHHMQSHHFWVTFLPAVKVASCKDEQG